MKTFHILKSGATVQDYIICDENGKTLNPIDEMCILIKANSPFPVATIVFIDGTVIQGYLYHMNVAAKVVP
jgi:hypothetical protein